MTGVYNPLVEGGQSAALFNNLAVGEQYVLKVKRKIRHLSLIQIVLAGAITLLGGFLFVDVDGDYHTAFSRFAFPDALMAGMLGLVCGLLGLRVSVQEKGRAVFMAYFVLTIVTAVFIVVVCVEQCHGVFRVESYGWMLWFRIGASYCLYPFQGS